MPVRRQLRTKGLSARSRSALAAAGYRDEQSLRRFRIEHLDELLTVTELDEIRQAVARSRLTGFDRVSARDRELLARHRVHPRDLDWALPHCGDDIGDDETGVLRLPPDIRDRLRPRGIDELLERFEFGQRRLSVPPGGGLIDPPGEGWTDPSRDGSVVDLARTGRIEHRAELTEVALLTDTEVVARIDELLDAGIAAVSRGDRAAALAVADRVVRVEAADEHGPAFRDRRDVVAQALGLLAAPGDSWQERVAGSVLRSAAPGTSAARVATVAQLASRRRAAESVIRVSGVGPARGRAQRARAATTELAALCLGAGADDRMSSPALAVHGLAAMTDLTRAVYAATLPAGTTAYPEGAPTGMAGRATVMPGWEIGRGGVSALGRPAVTMMVLRAFDRAVELEVPDLPVAGDGIFRFDWLLAEVRSTVTRLEHTDDLLLDLVAQLGDAAQDIDVLVEQALEAIASLVEQIREQVTQLAARLRQLVSEVVEAATSAAGLLGLLKVIGDWKWDQWAAMFRVVVDAVTAGQDPVAAVDSWIIGELSAGIGAVLDPLLARFDEFAEDLHHRMREAIIPPELLETLSSLLLAGGLLPVDEAEAAQRVEELLAPVVAARDAAVTTLLGTLATARADLAGVGAASFPPWFRALVFTYVVTPLVSGILIAAGIVLAGGPLGPLVLAALAFLGIEVIEAVIAGVLADLTGLARDLQATVDAAVDTALGLVRRLGALLSSLGGLEAVVGSLVSRIAGLADTLGLDGAAELQLALLGARDAVRAQLRTLLGALDTAFFRETFTSVARPGELTLATPTRPEPAPTGVTKPSVGPLYRELTLSSQLSALLPRYEAARVATQSLTGIRQSFTHVLSLADILGLPESSVPGATGLQTLLRVGGRLPFVLSPTLFDRFAPGIHGLLVKDVALQLDFRTPIEDEQELSRLLGSLGAASGGRLDPALVARTAGFGLPGLPVVPLRVPTGVPAVLTAGSTSYVRLSPSQVAPLAPFLRDGPCGGPMPRSERPPALASTELLDDPDPGAQAAGWRMLAVKDGPQSLMFSHFEVAADGVRFVGADKQLKPFEHRGAVGRWELQVPAVLRDFVAHGLPEIRDVRIVLSTVGQWSPDLAAALAPPARAVTVAQPREGVPASMDDLLDAVGDLLEAARLQNLFGPTAVVLPPVTSPGNVLRLLPLDTAGLANVAAVLLGAAEATFPVDAALLGGAGIDPAKLVGLREVRVGLLPDARALGSSLPTVPVTVTNRPTTTSPVVSATVDAVTGAATVPADAMAGATVTGLWSLAVGPLPAGTSLASAGMVLVAECLP